MRDWPVQTRLFAVILLALVTGLVFGGLRVADAVNGAEQLGRTAQLARLAEQDVVLMWDLENERDQTAGFLAGASPAVLHSRITVTNAQAARVGRLAAAIQGGFPADLRSEAAAVGSDATTYLPATRTNAQAMGPPNGALSTYAGPIGDLTLLDSQIAQGVSDSGLTDEVQTLTALSKVQDNDSQQRALLYNTFISGSLADGTQSALSTAMTEEQQEENAFGATATRAEAQAVNDTFATSQANTAATIENLVLTNGAPFSYLKVVGITSDPAGQWNRLISGQLDGLQNIELGIARTIVTRTQQLRNAAQVSAVTTGAASLAGLLLVLAAALAVARSLVRPLDRLRSGALEIATERLPARVRRLSEVGGDAADLEVVPIDVTSGDEIGQVARAFDRVHQEAVRLAGNEAMLRGSFNAMFVSLSRRSQVLIERLARQVDFLEQDEDNPERLAALFEMDHHVTRMRRNSENLLLLAGHEGSRPRGEAAPLADVARAAASEIERYERVQVRIAPGVSVAGPAVADIARLLAELIENATVFSPSDAPVYVSARDLAGDGIVVEVTDLGLGISADRLTELNERLDNPPVMDAYVARHMGLYAVARLAQRHGARVRLRPGDQRGVTALVRLPESVLDRTGADVPVPAPALAPRPNPAPAAGSRWFQRQAGASKTPARPPAAPADVPTQAPLATSAWGEQTPAGLPLRVPGAGRGPYGGPAVRPSPQRTPERARSTLSGFQRGARRAQDSAPGAEEGTSR